MEFVFSMEEIMNFDNVRDAMDLKNLKILSLPELEKDPYSDFEYYLDILKKKDIKFGNYQHSTLEDYIEEKIYCYMEDLLKEGAWENYLICLKEEAENLSTFGDAGEQLVREVYFKYNNLYFNFLENKIFVSKNGNLELGKWKTTFECLRENGITERDIKEIAVVFDVPNQNCFLRKEMKKLGKNFKKISPKRFYENSKKEILECFLDFNECNNFFFESTEQGDVDEYIYSFSNIGDLDEFIRENKQ